MSWLDRVAARAGIEPNEQQNIEPQEPEQDSAWKYINAGDISGFADWTNRNMNYRDIPFLGQLVGHTADAATQGVADLAQFAGAEGVGNYLNEKAQEGESRLAPMSTPELSLNYVTDPNGLTSATGMLLGSMLSMAPATMLVPEAAALRAGALLKGLPKVGGFASEFAPKAVKWAATGPIEAAMEGGNTERQMLESGASREEANRAKWDAFKGNVALLTATNALEGGLLGKVAKVKTPTFENGILNTASKAAGYLPATAAESALQGYEEGAQQGIQEGAMSGAMDLNHILSPNAWNDEQWENAKFAVAGGLPMVGGSALIRRFGGNTPTASANELLEQAQASTAQKLAADSAPAQAEVATAQPAFGLVSDAATETQAQSGNALPTYDQKFYTIADEVSDTALDADTEARLNILSHDYQEQFGEPLYVTSMKRNGDGSSWHDSGQAFDIAGGGLETNENGEREWLIQRGQALGLTPLDEYAHPSEHATGGHIHFSNHEDGSAPSIGGTQGGAVDVSSLTGGNIAMAISQRTGLPAQFIWAQMAHESANFQSDLARKDHNYAGVKGTDGEYLHFDSDEDFVNYMADYLPEYSNNGIFNAKNVDEYAQALKDGGYFGDTVENYAGDMKNILSRAGFSQSGRSNLMNDKPSFDINRDDETGRKMVADFVSYWSNATDNADDMNELETMLDRNGKFRNTPENRANVREKFGDAYQQFADARMQEEAKKQEAATQAATPSVQKPVQQAAGASPNAPSDLVSMQTPNLDQTANRKADTNAPTNQTQGFTMEDAPQAQAAAQPSARPQSAQQNANQQGTRQNTAQNVQTQTATTQPSTQSTTPERNTQQASTTQAAQQANAVETALMHFGINKVNDLERANGNTSTPESMRLRQALQERNTAAILSMYPQEAAQAVAPVLQPARPARQQKRAQRKETNATPLQLQQGQNLVTLARQNNVKLPKGMVGALMRGYGIDSATKELAKHGVAVPQQTKGEAHENPSHAPAPAQSQHTADQVQNAELQPRKEPERREEAEDEPKVTETHGGRGKSVKKQEEHPLKARAQKFLADVKDVLANVGTTSGYDGAAREQDAVKRISDLYDELPDVLQENGEVRKIYEDAMHSLNRTSGEDFDRKERDYAESLGNKDRKKKDAWEQKVEGTKLTDEERADVLSEYKDAPESKMQGKVYAMLKTNFEKLPSGLDADYLKRCTRLFFGNIPINTRNSSDLASLERAMLDRLDAGAKTFDEIFDVGRGNSAQNATKKAAPKGGEKSADEIREELIDLAAYAWVDKKFQGKVSFRPSEKLNAKLEELFGHTVDEVFITADDVRHLKNNHSNGEERRGQRSLVAGDVASIYDVVNDFDGAEIQRSDNKGNKTALFWKTSSGKMFTLLIERGKRKAEVKTAYDQNKKETSPMPDAKSSSLNVRNDSAKSPSASSIPQEKTEKQSEKPSDADDFHGYLATKAPNIADTIRTALAKNINPFGGKGKGFMTLKRIVEDYARGDLLYGKDSSSKKGSKYYLGSIDVTKGGYEYYQYLKEHTPEDWKTEIRKMRAESAARNAANRTRDDFVDNKISYEDAVARINAAMDEYAKVDKNTAERDRKWNLDRLDSINRDKHPEIEAAEKVAADKAEREAYHGFLDNKTNLAAGNAKKALSVRERRDGQALTRKDYTEQAANDQAYNMEKAAYKGKTQYRLFRGKTFTIVTKTEYDYFNYLRDHAGKAPATNPKESLLTLIKKAEAIGEAQYDGKQSPQDALAALDVIADATDNAHVKERVKNEKADITARVTEEYKTARASIENFASSNGERRPMIDGKSYATLADYMKALREKRKNDLLPDQFDKLEALAKRTAEDMERTAKSAAKAEESAQDSIFGDKEQADRELLEELGINPDEEETLVAPEGITNTAEVRAQLEKELSAELNKISANPVFNPKVYELGVRIAFTYVKDGMNTAKKLIATLNEKFGDAIAPWSPAIVETVRTWPKGVAFDAKTVRALSKAVGAHYEQGTQTRAGIHAEMKELFKGRYDSYAPMIDAAYNGIEKFFNAKEAENNGHGTRPREGADRGHEVQQPREVRGTEEEGQPRGHRGGVPVEGEAEEGRVLQDDGEAAAENAESVGSVPGNEPHHDGDRGNGERGNHELAALRDDQAKPAAEKTPGHDYTIEGDGPAPKTPKQRFDANVEAIKLLKQLEAEGRMPTPAEQSVLAAYSSWGGLTKAFEDGTKENKELRKLLTKDEYEAANRSILDAYFTPPAIVRAIWKGVSSLGFQGGRVLDPSMGVGNFFGCMPKGMRKASALSGVELDNLSSRFAKMLYPSADIENTGFQNAHVADDSCDLVISNVPFGQKQVGPYAIHNYFFAQGIDKVRPGGLMVFITSQSSLTSGGDAATMRSYLASKADFIGGFKLPSGVFKGTGTDVATDVLVFQKRVKENAPSEHGQNFQEIIDHPLRGMDKDGHLINGKAKVNAYFMDERSFKKILGSWGLGKDQYGKFVMEVTMKKGQDVAKDLAAAMRKLPNVYKPVNRTDEKQFQQKPADKKARNDEKRRDMEYFTDGGKLYQNQDGVRVAVPTRKAKAVKAYLGVRESLRTLFLAENDPDAKPSVLDSLRKKLNQTYDAFVKAHGFLNEPKNVRLFGDDPSSGSVLALESDVKLEGKGAQRRVVSAQKAGIFHQRTVQAVKPVTHADNAKDALLASLNQTGKVDVDYMAKLTGKSPAAVVQELGDTIYQDPTTEGYETADEYLSGNVREKLAQAQKAAKKNPTYQRNVDALKKVVPADLVSSEILVNINSPWIPVEDLNAFMEHLTGASATSWQGMTVSRASNGRYVVDGSGYGASKWKPDGVEFRDLIDSVLNNKPIEVAHKDEDGHRIVDQEKTDAANAAADRIRDEFQNWIWSDKTREQRLAKYYNENYNGEVLRTYDGSHLTFPGMNSGVKLRGHQKNVIWRMLQKVNTLIAHCVGAGKTWEMQAAGMEMRRLGIANKPLYCVPNNIVEQFAREFQTLYPNAKLLVLKTGDDLPEVFRAKVTKTEDGRKVVHYLKPSQMSKADRAKYEEKCRARLRALTRIKTEDWDGIIMSHNMFERLPVSGETTAAYIKEEIAILEQTLKEAEARKQRGKNANGLRVRDLQTRLETLKSKLEEATNQDLKAVGIPFEELGIDQIFVDEADMFKNLHFMTTIGDVSGLTNPKSANRSTDMFIKTQWLTKRNGGRGVVFATGTPISNTMAEMYTMMRYLDSAGLKERGVELFDNWIRQYGDIGTGIERKPSGDGYRKVQKVKHFLNMPELTKAFRKFTDVFTRDELIEEDPNITIPKLKNDKRTVIALAPDPAIVDYIKRVVPERIKNMKGRGKQKKGDDNMLALTNDLRKLSMTDKKIDACAEQVAKKYRETDAEHGAQAIFCDMGVPRAEKENATSTDRDANESAAETENKAVYDRLIASLVAHGIPREQIAFAQQAKNKQAQDELFQKVDRGDIRVIIGTTQKMGAGTNFQRHLAAEHHLDAPWRPRDIEQREGRILRQGNGNKEVEIFTYVVKDSFDANMWEKIKNKASIISQAMSPNIMERSLEDADLVTLSYADVESAATGNPYIKQMLDAKADVAKLTNASTQFQKQQHDAERKAKELPATIKNEKNILALIEEDKAARIDTHGDKFQMEIAGKTYDKRADADKALDALPLKTTPQDVGHIGEYRIRAWVDMGGETHAEIVRNRAYPANKLNAQSIERALRDGVDGAAKAHDGNIKSQQQELKDAKDVLKEQNPYTEKLKAAREQQRQLEQKINDYMTEKPQATDSAPTASVAPTETEEAPKETFDVNQTPFSVNGSYVSYDGKLSKATYDALRKLAEKDGADEGSFFVNEEAGLFSTTFNYRRTNTKRDTFIRDAMKLIEQDKAAQEAPATSNTWREILSAPTKNELAEKIRKHLKSRYLTIGGVNADGTYHVSSLATYKEISDGVVREVNGEWQFGKYEEAKKPYNLDNSLHVATADNRKWFDEHVHVAGIPDAHYRKQTEVNAETETEKKRRELKEVYEEPDSRVKINGPFLYLDGEGLGHAQIRNMRGMLEDLAQGQARSLKAVGGSKMLGVQPKFQYYISNNYSLMMRIKEAIDKEYPKHSQETKAETSNQPSKPTHYEVADVFRSTALWNPTTGKTDPNAKLTIQADHFTEDALETIADSYGGDYDPKQERFFFDNAESRDKFVRKAMNFINGHTDHVHYSVSIDENPVDNVGTRGDNEVRRNTRESLIRFINNPAFLRHIKDDMTVEQLREILLAQDIQHKDTLVKKLEDLPRLAKINQMPAENAQQIADATRNILKDALRIINRKRRMLYEPDVFGELERAIRSADKGKSGSRLEESLSRTGRELASMDAEGVAERLAARPVPGEHKRIIHPIEEEIQQELTEENHAQHHSVSRSENQSGFSRAKEAEKARARSMESIKREVVKAFPGAKNIRDVGNRITFDMPNDSHVEIRIHDNMTVTGEEATRARRAHGIADGVTIRVNGSMYTLGRDVVIDLSRRGDVGTSYHEALHAAMELLFDDKAKAALHKKYGSEEKIADAYRKFMLAEQRGGHVPFAKLFRAIRDFFRGLASHISPIRERFGDAWTAQKAFEDLASGKAWETKGGKRSHGFSLFSVAEAAENPIDNGRGRGDNKGEERAVFIDRFLNEKVPEEGRTRIASDVENGITTYAGEITPENIEDVFDSLHCVKMLRSTFLDKGRMESYDNGLEYAKNMAAYMYGYARRCFENDERIQRQLALRGASLGRPETVRDLNAQGRAGRSNAGTPRNGGQTYKGTSLAKHGNVTALQEVYDQLIDEEYSKHEKHYSVSRSERQDGFSSTRKSDTEYMDAVDRYQKAATDEDRAQALSDLQRMVQEAAENAGFHDAIPEQTKAYRIRTGKAPQKTLKVYKVFTVAPDGAPTALFVSGTEKLPQGVWLDAQAAYHFTAGNGKDYVPSTQNPYTKGGKTGGTVVIPSEEVRQELIERGFLKPGSTAKNITALAYRPGWHAGTLPFFPQGGKKNAAANYGMMHRANQVVFECELAADKDYTQEARSQEKARTKEGKLNLQKADLQYLPENGFYYYATNPLTQSHPELGAWAISGSLKINRALTQEECDRILAANNMKPQAWEQGKLNLADLGYTGEQNDAARKTLAPITYDDAGEVIPLSERFNAESPDVRYSISEEKEAAEEEEETAKRGRSFVKAAADKLGKALHLKSDKIMLEEDSKDPTKDINLKQAFLQSPSRVAAKVPVFRAFYTMACRAMDKNVGLRNDFNRKFDGALAGLKKAEREELFDTLLKGDAEGKEWTRDDLIADGASEAVADAYIKIRRQLNKAYHLVDKARRKPEPKSKSVTEDELKFLRENKFVDNLHVTDKGIGEDGKHRYLASYMEARNYKRAYKGITADRLAAFQADDGIQVVTAEPAKSESGQAMYGADGKPLYNVITAEGPAHLNKLTGYIPHFFHEYMIRVVDKDGKARVVGSARNQREAVQKGEAWLKENDLADGESIHVAPKVFDINKALGVSDDDYAPVMGDRDFYRVQQNLAKQNDMTLAEAKEMLDGAVRLKGRHRFFGNAMHRTGAQGYETDLNWALRHYFNSASRYVAMETEFKPKAISYFERMFGAFDKDYTGLAKYCKDYINDINGNPSALEEAISKALNSTYLFKKVIIPTFGDRAALTLGNGIATKVSYLTLGLNMSSALLNFTQLANAAAYIGDVSSLVTMVNRGRHHKYSRRDLRILHETGVFNDIGLDSGSGYDQMRGGAPSFGTGRFARGLSGVNRVIDYAGNKSMFFFRQADAICRRGTVLAAYEKARKDGKTHAEAIAFAKEVNDKANFQYGVQDAANVFRRGSIVSQLLLQFKKYGFKELEVMSDFSPWSKSTSKKQKLMFWAIYAMLCGAMGVPALDWLDEIFGEKTGFYTKDEIQKAIIGLCGSNKRLAAAAMYGVPAIFGMNISNRAGMSDVIPTSLGDLVAGPTFSKAFRFTQDFAGGNWANALRDVSPGLYNLYAGYSGESRGKRGRLNDRYTTAWDRILRAVGFRSVEESVPVDMQRIISRDKAALTKERQAAQDAYIENPTSENKARLKELGINPKTVTKEAQKKQQTREERMEGSVSKKDAARYKPLTDYAKGW
ncbi:glucosaminidase domain-containing protein [Selenomonas sp.]|uniref:glucosaminidase domain-containing protein n=1 Tax=Selenomonas sp. TaxID=2053611 RepID=UPI0025F381BA|nr:glucosaminidase domain-containing protein [Selenomonas sp.]MCI6283595.1 glucosaminidase domain-containing protein [Selenomonas sp.]